MAHSNNAYTHLYFISLLCHYIFGRNKINEAKMALRNDFCNFKLNAMNHLKHHVMKSFILLLLFSITLLGCGSHQSVSTNTDHIPEEDIVTIANEEIEYEITIIEPGFNAWLASMARPEGYYSQSFMESRNKIYVMEWNSRVLQANRFDPNLYEMRIDYQPDIDYGYEVNYKLYNYFIYFQMTYDQQLSTIVPRI